MTSDKEKFDRYFTRTVEHIHRVQKNMLYLVTNFREKFEFKSSTTGLVIFSFSNEACRKLMFNVMKHDQSKFSETQFIPYVELTEFYHQRRVLGNTSYEYPSSEIKNSVEIAVNDHYCKENHHPERTRGQIVPHPYLSFEELVEVVCDLQAMAQEFNEGSCRGYFENVWCKKQAMNFRSSSEWDDAKRFMNEVIKLFEMGIE